MPTSGMEQSLGYEVKVRTICGTLQAVISFPDLPPNTIVNITVQGKDGKKLNRQVFENYENFVAGNDAQDGSLNTDILAGNASGFGPLLSREQQRPGYCPQRGDCWPKRPGYCPQRGDCWSKRPGCSAEPSDCGPKKLNPAPQPRSRPFREPPRFFIPRSSALSEFLVIPPSPETAPESASPGPEPVSPGSEPVSPCPEPNTPSTQPPTPTIRPRSPLLPPLHAQFTYPSSPTICSLLFDSTIHKKDFGPKPTHGQKPPSPLMPPRSNAKGSNFDRSSTTINGRFYGLSPKIWND